MGRAKILIIVFAFILPMQLFGQYDTVYWRTEAAFVELTDDEIKGNDAVIIEDNRAVVYKLTYRNHTRHKIIHISTQDGLDANNKIVIHVPDAVELSSIRARTISKDGEIEEMGRSSMKEVENYEGGGGLKMYAIEGAEVGGQIEYEYILREPLYDSGKENLSMDYPTKKACILIRWSTSYAVDTKGYNADFDMRRFKLQHYYHFKDIPPIADEKYAVPDANRPYVVHKIKGSQRFQSDFANYPSLFKSFQKTFFEMESADLKKGKSAIKGFEITEGDEENTLKRLNEFLKAKFTYEPGYDDELEQVPNIVKTGLGNDFGLTKLYCAALTHLDIKHQVLITTNKYDMWLDPKFASRYTADEYIIYFPDYETYIYPSAQVAQYGLIPSWLCGNKALIIDKTLKTANFREVESRLPELNQTNLKIDVKLNLAKSNSTIQIAQYGSGQIAYDYNYEYYYAESDADKKKELLNLIDWRYPESKVVSIETVNDEAWGDISKCEDYECKRHLKATVESSTLYDRAGNNLLVNVGKLIGPQTELYSERERVQRVTCAHNKSYSFVITIDIPEGYSFAGTENAEFDNEFAYEDGEKVAGFKSEVEATDDQVVIKIYEYYAKVNIGKKYYQDYRKIINSAADFNKATILFKKN